jgi:hypothetical protein
MRTRPCKGGEPVNQAIKIVSIDLTGGQVLATGRVRHGGIDLAAEMFTLIR